MIDREVRQRREKGERALPPFSVWLIDSEL